MDDRLKPYIDMLRLVRKMMPNKEYNLAIYDKPRRLAFFEPGNNMPENTRAEKIKSSICVTFNDPTGALDKVLDTGITMTNSLPQSAVGSARYGTLVSIYDGNLTELSSEQLEHIKGITKSLEEVVGRY